MIFSVIEIANQRIFFVIGNAKLCTDVNHQLCNDQRIVDENRFNSSIKKSNFQLTITIFIFDFVLNEEKKKMNFFSAQRFSLRCFSIDNNSLFSLDRANSFDSIVADHEQTNRIPMLKSTDTHMDTDDDDDDNDCLCLPS